ncbi:hypothetical protein PRIPAC_73891 [Pristionchus pacificus]|nr:hypothetical protein PRIPAC_73891 [Pristionchus pacificus]
MTSFIVRDVPTSYFPPGAVMYLSEGGALPRVGDESEEEEDEGRDRMGKYKEKKDTRAPHAQSGIRKGAEGSRSSLAKRNSDSAYSSMDRRSVKNDNDDCISTASSVPVDPSTQVPVFLSAMELEFVVAGDSPDGRRILTLYNPYDYPFEFKIFCTAPEHYDIKFPSGSLVKSKHLVEMTIRAMPTLMPNMVHRIKVDIKRIGRNEVLGSRIVTLRAVAYPSSYQNTGEHGAFHQMGGSERRREMERGGDPRRRMDERSVNYGRDIRIEPADAQPHRMSMLILVTVLCLIALCLPIQREMEATETVIPQFLHITHTQRVMAAFILGVCTVFILKPER